MKRWVEIGQEFLRLGDTYRITDVGRRTVLAVNVTATLVDHGRDESWLNGPPYGVDEHVFDETDYGVLAEHFELYRWLQRCPNSVRGHSLEWQANGHCDYCGKKYPDGVHGRVYIDGSEA